MEFNEHAYPGTLTDRMSPSLVHKDSVPLACRVIGSLGVWEFGNLGIWEFGSLGVWEFGNLGVWKLGKTRGHCQEDSLSNHS